jgi:hypothetical protein
LIQICFRKRLPEPHFLLRLNISHEHVGWLSAHMRGL